MTYEEAEEYLSFNTEGAYVGESGPIFMELWSDTLVDFETTPDTEQGPPKETVEPLSDCEPPK